MKIQFPATLRSRLALFNAIFLTVVMLLTLTLLYFLLDVWVYQQTDDALIILAKQAEEGVSLKNNLLNYEQRVTNSELDRQRQFMRILTIDGKVHQHFGPLKDLPVDIVGVRSYSSNGSFRNVTKPLDDEVFRVYTLPIITQGKIIGFVQAGQSLEIAENMLQLLMFALLLLIPITLLVTLLGSRWITARALAPLSAIADTAERISEQEMHQRLGIPGSDEVARLAGSLDRMLDRLEDAFDRYRQFTGDASHELRTPLTVMKGEISLALQKEREHEYYTQTLGALDLEVDRLTRMVEQLLTLARADVETASLHLQTVSLQDFLVPLVERAQLLASSRDQQINWEIPTDVALTTDCDILQQIVFNLLDNAVKYSGEGSVISVKVKSSPHHLTIAISDSGPGIAADQLDHIFDRFYRVDKSRSREMGGTGLGLAIAKRLAQQLGGNVIAKSTVGKGSTFLIELPKVRSAYNGLQL